MQKEIVSSLYQGYLWGIKKKNWVHCKRLFPKAILKKENRKKKIAKFRYLHFIYLSICVILK